MTILRGEMGAYSILRPMSFTGELWSAMTPIYQTILRHPFVTGLTDGTLPRDSFRFYAVQDALYLREFARALSLAAARAPEDDWIIMFNEHSAGALKVERALHEGFFKEFGLSPAEVAATPLAPTNVAYTSYLLAVAYGAPFHEALALLLDLLGGRQDTRGRRLARSALRAMDRHLRLRRVRRRRARGARRHRHDRRALASARARRDASSRRHHQPLRVDVLGHGLAPRGLARLKSRSGTVMSSRRHG